MPNQLKAHVEWGYASPWGMDPAKDKETAEQIVENMKKAGHHAWVIKRLVSDWQDAEERVEND